MNLFTQKISNSFGKEISKKIISFSILSLVAILVIPTYSQAAPEVTTPAKSTPEIITPAGSSPEVTTPAKSTPETQTQPSKQTLSTTLDNPLNATSVEGLIYKLVQTALQLGVIAATLALIWTGFQFVLAQGDPGKITDAKKRFFWTVIGIAVLFGAQAIALLVQTTIQPFLKP